MATYRKPLKDIDGNTIIPAMTGDQTEWIQTGDIANGAVTMNKIDSSSFTEYIKRYMFTDYGATDLTITNIDLNSTEYCSAGKYVCTTGASGATQTNNPSGTAYQMWVIDLLHDTFYFSGNWKYFMRIMFALNGIWVQQLSTNGSGTEWYGSWRRLDT